MITAGLDVERRPTTADDVPFLREMFAESRDDLALLPTDIRGPLIEMQFVAQRTQQQTTYPDASSDILVVDGRDVGQLIQAGTHVVDITVGQAHRRRGIATAVLRAVIVSNAPRATTLQVWSANNPARALYEGLGFDVFGSEGGYLAMTHRCRS